MSDHQPSWRERLLEGTRDALERRTEFTIQSKERLNYLEESDFERRLIQKDLDLMAYTALNYVGGAPQELKPVERRRLAQRSRIVWMKDPQAGAAVDLMNDFVFGRGMQKPKANDPQVQEVIDEAWSDPDNQLVLTSFQAQLALGTDLELQSNLFLLIFEDGTDGKVKLGLLDHDTVETVVRDPDNRLRILYYVARHYIIQWDFENDRPMVLTTEEQISSNAGQAGSVPTRPENSPLLAPGQGALRYYEHWRNVEDLEEDIKNDVRPAIPMCPPNKLGDGKVFHVAMNRGSEMAFGHPRMDRLIRWFNCHAQETETLTSEGWLGYDELKRRWADGTLPPVAGYDMRTGELRYERPMEMHSYPYAGEMIRFASKRGGMHALVTPNHDMLVRGRFGDWEKAPAGELTAQDAREVYVPRAALTAGPLVESFVLPSVPMRDTGSTTAAWHAQALQMYRDGLTPAEIAARVNKSAVVVRELVGGALATRRKHHAPLELPMHAWLEYIGWYVAEGYGDGVVTQSIDSPVLGCLMACVERLGVDGMAYRSVRSDGRYADQWSWTPKPRKQFGRWLREHCGEGALNKHVPRFVFGLNAIQQMFVLRGLLMGDGTAGPDWTPDKSAVFYTSSPQLADDCQHLATGCGLIATRRDSRRGEYTVHVSPDTNSKLPVPVRESYEGDVYCFSMPSGTMVTRLAGRTAITGNSYNSFMDARVDIMAASAAFVMKRKVKGTPQQLERMANQALSRRSLLGMTRDPEMGAELGPKSGGIITENDAVSHEDFNISTNAPQAAQDAQMIRSQISAATRWPASYYGDASQSNLATATSLELPVLKAVETRQEIFESLIRFFIDRVIERAVDTGRISAQIGQDGAGRKATKSRPDRAPGPVNVEPTDLNAAYEDEGRDEQATARDLGYEFRMPSPLKRMLGDVVTAVQAVATTFDPNNSNTQLSRTLLAIALGELDLEDPAGAVEKIFPAGYVDPMVAAQEGPPGGGQQQPFASQYSPSASTSSMDAFDQDPNNGYTQGFGAGNSYGAVSGSQSPEDAMEAAMHRNSLNLSERAARRAKQVDHMLDEELNKILSDS